MPDPIDAYIRAAAQAGCTQEQVQNFLAAGYIAQPRQLTLHATARMCDREDGPDQVGFGGARGPGKSHAVFAQIALDDAVRFPGITILYLRKFAKNAREQLNELRMSVLKDFPHEYAAQGGVIRIGESKIIIGHFASDSDVDKHLGMQYPIIAVEEATTLSLFKYRTLRDSNRSSNGVRPRIYLTTNPGGIGHAWFKRTFVDAFRAGNETYTRFIPATVDDNVFIDSGYARKLEENTGWRLQAYRWGEWDIAAGQYFTNFRRNAHVIRPFSIPEDWRVWGSLDYGYQHPTVAMLHTKDGDGNIYTIGEHSASHWQPEDHAREIFALMDRLNIRPHRIRTWAAGTDAFIKREGPSIAEKYSALGMILKPAHTDRVGGAAHMLNLLGDPEREIVPRWFIFETCKGLAEQLPAMESDPHHHEDVLKVDVDEDGLGGDDYYDCARYGLMESRQAAGLPAAKAEQSKWNVGGARSGGGSRWSVA